MKILPHPGEGDHPQDGGGAGGIFAHSAQAPLRFPPVPLHPRTTSGGPPPRFGEDQ